MKDSLVISRTQLKALNSPIRIELMTALRASGPSSVADLAEYMGKQEHLLYYHINRLVAVGLVKVDELRPGTTRPESIYAATNFGTVQDLDLEDDAIRSEVVRNIQTVLKTSTKEYCQAVEARRNASFEDCTLARLVCSLSPERKAELNSRITEIRQWILGSTDEGGEKHSFTIAITPLS
jgi:predicted ArsR family transcriptional regulator